MNFAFIFCLSFIASNLFLASLQAQEPPVPPIGIPPIVQASSRPAPSFQAQPMLQPDFSGTQVMSEPAFEFESSEVMSSCGEASCDTPGCKGCGTVWYSSVEATFLQLRMDRPSAYAGAQDAERTKLIEAQTDTQMLDGFYTAPRITLGAKRGKNDIVFRYWHLGFAESKFIDSDAFNRAGQPNETASSFDMIDFDAYTLDLELQRSLCRGKCDTKLIFGSRYVNLESSAYAHVSDTYVRNTLGSIDTYAERNYKGLGFVTGLAGSRSLRGPWSLTFAGRASGIFGTSYQHQSNFGAFNGDLNEDFALAEATVRNSATGTKTIIRDPSPSANYNVDARASAVAPENNTLWIFEGQLGLRRSHRLMSIPATAHFDFGFEYQFWALPDAQLDTAIVLGNTFADPVDVSPNIDLTGFFVNAGITY